MGVITNLYNSNNESKDDLFNRIQTIMTELVAVQNNAEGFEWAGDSAGAVKNAWAELTGNFKVFADKVGNMFGENITFQNVQMENTESDIVSQVNSQDLTAG